MKNIYSIDQPHETVYISKSYNYLSHRQISFMVASREHPKELMDSIISVFDLATYPEKIEMVVRIDNDDIDVFNILKNSDFINSYNIKIYVGKRYGFRNMHRYWNEIAAFTVGDLLIPWGEGLQMMDKGWDEELYQYRDGLYIINNETYNFKDGQIKEHFWANLSPGLTRKVYDITGRVAPSALIDGYIDHLGGRSGIKKYTKVRVILSGDQIPNPDEQLAHAHGMSDDIKNQLDDDIDRILSHRENKEILPNIYVSLEDGPPLVDLTGGEESKKYLVEFINKENNQLVYSMWVSPYHWCCPRTDRYKNWKIRASTEDGRVFFDKDIDLRG